MHTVSLPGNPRGALAAPPRAGLTAKLAVVVAPLMTREPFRIKVAVGLFDSEKDISEAALAAGHGVDS